MVDVVVLDVVVLYLDVDVGSRWVGVYPVPSSPASLLLAPPLIPLIPLTTTTTTTTTTTPTTNDDAEEEEAKEEVLEFVCCVFGGFQTRKLAFWQSGASQHHLQ